MEKWQQTIIEGARADAPMFKVGDWVHWTQIRYRGRQIDLRRLDGEIEAINGDIATVVVKRKRRRRYQVSLSNLRRSDQPSRLHELIFGDQCE